MGGEVRTDREAQELELRQMLRSGFMPTGTGLVKISEDVAKAIENGLDVGKSFENGEVVDVEYPEPE